MLAGCGRFGFAPIGSGDGAGAVAGSAGAADALDLGPCLVFSWTSGFVDLLDFPPLAWRSEGVLVGHITPMLEVQLLGGEATPLRRIVDVRTVAGGDAIATDSGFLVGWTASGAMFMRLVDRDGVPIGGELAVGTTIGRFDLARNGNEIGGVWKEGTSVVFRRFDLAGAPLAPPITLAAGISVDDLVATDAGYALVASNASDALIVRFTASGTVTNVIPIGPANQMRNVQIAGAGAAQYFSWDENLGQSAFVGRVDAAGTVSTPAPVATSSGGLLASVGWTGDRVAVVVHQRDTTTQELRLDALWFDVALAPLGMTPLNAKPWPNPDAGAFAIPKVLGAPGRLAVTAVYEVTPSIPTEQTTIQHCD